MRQRIGVLAYLIVTALAYTAGPALGGSTTVVGRGEHIVGVDLGNSNERKGLQ